MTTINEIFKQFGPEYIETFGASMPQTHLKVIDAIVNCRTGSYGMALYECEKCHQHHMVNRSCGNRHCPLCQGHKTRLWLQRQLDRQLPGHHFMMTFTVPEQLRFFIRGHQRVAYAAMFKASSEAMKLLCTDEKYIGGDLPGFFGVLHTWGRTSQYHPHIHYVVPGGAFSKDDGRWHPSRQDFYLPVKALSKIFRAKFRHEIQKHGLLDPIDQKAWQIDWNVNCQAVGTSANSIAYLAPYVFKVAMSNSRIVKVENRRVHFRYKKPKSERWRTMDLDAMEFMRRFLQHVLPTGLMKVRYYGFLNPNCSVPLDEIETKIELAYGFNIETPEKPMTTEISLNCPHCGGKLIYQYSVLPYQLPPEKRAPG
jgi:hypothetical protein